MGALALGWALPASFREDHEHVAATNGGDDGAPTSTTMISVAALQILFLKSALLLGVEVGFGLEYQQLRNCGHRWQVICTPTYATKDSNSHEYCSRNSNIHEDAAVGIDRCGPAQRAAATALARSLSGFPPDEVATATKGVEGDAGGGAEIWALLGAFGSADVCTDPCATPRV
eukprot:COSAG05_NODE_4707_length_1403_cov_1.760736_1_plen_172_part_10